MRDCAPIVDDEIRPAFGDSFTIQIFDAFSDVEFLHSAWNDLVLRSQSDIYQTFEWCHIWWRHYGFGRKLQLVLCFSGTELVGVIPAFVEDLMLWPVRIKVAKLIGADSSIQFCNLAVMSHLLEMAVFSAIHRFIEELKCDVFVIGPLSGPTAKIDDILLIGRNQTRIVYKADRLGSSVSTRFELPTTFPSYLKKVGGRQIGKYKRSLKRFADEHHVASDVLSEPEAVRLEFENFKLLHEAQWASEGKLGHFRDWPSAIEFNHDLINAFSRIGMARFFRILADGQVASSQFCLQFGGVNYWRLPGRDCRQSWSDLSLGRMGLVKMIEASISIGMRAIEGGRGHYSYKLQLGGEEWPLATIQFTRRGPGVDARVRGFRLLASLLDTVYYRIIFMRLASKFRCLRHSLWPIWIRSTW
jgi:CelD/BcsL family acetyltransferase involved in cellulose biosynthesis